MKYLLIGLTLFILLSCNGATWIDMPKAAMGFFKGKCTTKKANKIKKGHLFATGMCGEMVKKKYSGQARCRDGLLQLKCID